MELLREREGSGGRVQAGEGDRRVNTVKFTNPLFWAVKVRPSAEDARLSTDFVSDLALSNFMVTKKLKTEINHKVIIFL